MSDAIDHPPHYVATSIEPIDVVEAWGLGFHLGNAVKYIARAGHKDGAHIDDDLAKAAWYIDRERIRRRRVRDFADAALDEHQVSAGVMAELAEVE